MSLIQGEQIFDDLNNIEIFDNNKSKPYFSLTSLSKGRWYFEYNHLNGSYAQVIGYQCNDFSLTACPKGNSSKLYLYTSSQTAKINGLEKDYTDLYFPDVENDRVGIAIDIDSSRVSFIWNNEIRTFSFGQKCNDCKIMARELSNNNQLDYVSIYLNNFQYKPPFNALPWGSSPYTTKICKQCLSNLPFYSVFLLHP